MPTTTKPGASFAKAADRTPEIGHGDFSGDEDALQATLVEIFGDVVKNITEEELQRLMLGGSLDPLFVLIDLREQFDAAARIAEALRVTTERQGRAALGMDVAKWRARQERGARSIGVKTVPSGVVNMSFDVLDRHVINWAERRAAVLVVEITEEMRNAIRMEAIKAVSGQYTAKQLKAKLARIIPLHSRYANAVTALEKRTLARYLKEGVSLARAETQTARLATRYARKLTLARAQNIARTEIMTASNEGQFIGHKIAQNAGLLPADAEKEWITAEDEDVCPTCGPLHGTRVALDQPFPTGRIVPPAHPSCRCSYNMVTGRFDDMAERYGEGWL